LAIKAMSGMIAQHAKHDAGLVLAIAASPFPYVTVGCSALGMLIFQTGLQRCRVSIVGPVSNITGSVFFLVLGTWLFGERLPADPAKLALRLAGIVLAAVVVIALSRRPSRAVPAVPPAVPPAAPEAAAPAAAPAGLMPRAEPADGTAAPMIGAA
jgi:multidrug transporter EmrE-like cation transporter